MLNPPQYHRSLSGSFGPVSDTRSPTPAVRSPSPTVRKIQVKRMGMRVNVKRILGSPRRRDTGLG